MRHLVLFLALILAIATSCYAQQSPWQWVNPLPQGNLLNGVWAASPETAYAVGELGTVLKTTSGGVTWQVDQNVAGTSDQLFAVQFVSGTVGWAVGEFGRVIKTTNGGITWFSQFAPTSADLYAVFFFSPTQGWVAGNNGAILSTTNGGSTWVPDTSHTTSTIFGVYFRTSTSGWAVGTSGKILHSTNGGISWSAQVSGSTQALYSIQFTSATNGLIVGSFGTILKTVNGGTNWTPVVSPTDLSLYGIQFTSALNGSAVGAYGALVRTTDGGTTWLNLNSPTSNDIFGLRFPPSSTFGIAVGDFGTILATSDGGASWYQQSNGVKNTLDAINFPSTDVGFAVGDIGTIVKTTNAGKTWTDEVSGTFQPLYGVYFINASTGWVVGDSASILKSTNGGFTWVEENSHTDPTMYSIFFPTVDSGWAVGDFGTILRTVNGGTLWTAETSKVNSSLLKVKFANSKIGWAVGYDGTIVKTTNGGVKWAAQTSNTFLTLYSIEVINTTTAYAVGDFGVILRTTNGGTTWTPLTSNSDASLTGVTFLNPSHGWASGDDGSVVATTDGGATWSIQTTGTEHILWEIQAIHTSSTGGILFATGEGGTILGSSISPFPVRTWTGSFDSLWTNPGNWNPSGVPRKEDSVFIPLTANNPVLRNLEQQINLSALTIGPGARLTIGSGLSQLLVRGNITVLGTLQIESNAFLKIFAGGNFSTNFGGTFIPGKSTVDLTNVGQIKGTFYNLILDDSASIQTVGNVSVLNNVTLLSNLNMRQSDTLSVLNPDPAAIEGDFFVPKGTIKRVIGAGTTTAYRFESAITYVQFYQTGVMPTAMTMTVHPNEQPPGLPDSIYIKRYYTISAEGGSNYKSTLSLRYDTAESKFSIDELALFRDSSGVILNMGASDFLDSDIVSVSVDSIRGFSQWYLGRSDFIPHHPLDFLDSLYLTDHGNLTDTLLFGAKLGATDGIDPGFGESELAAKPVSGFDVRWVIPPTRGTIVDIRNYLTPEQVQRTYTLTMQAGAGGFPFTLRWNSALLGAGTFFLEDQATQGAQFTINMKSQNSFVVASSSNSTVQIVHRTPIYYAYSTGWNMISIPITPTSDGKRAHVFPASSSAAFAYSAGYVITDVLTAGPGYWLKFPIAQTVGLEGLPISTDTIPIATGWNMIGSVSSVVSKNNVIQVPASNVASNYFGYEGSYVVSDSIRPAKAYWVKAKNAGQLILSGGAANAKQTASDESDDGLSRLNTITLSDRSGSSQTLYFGSAPGSSFTVENYDLPPRPPSEVFDARFASDRMVELLNGKSSTVKLEFQSGAYPVNVSWHINQPGIQSVAVVSSSNGRLLAPASGGADGRITISNASVTGISFKVDASISVPREFSLKQNYPNPFNPTTTIEFELPVQAGVTLKVFNLLGQQVALLAENQQFLAGEHLVNFNASNLGSGIYFYQISARSGEGKDFQQVKKMVLLK